MAQGFVLINRQYDVVNCAFKMMRPKSNYNWAKFSSQDEISSTIKVPPFNHNRWQNTIK